MRPDFLNFTLDISCLMQHIFVSLQSGNGNLDIRSFGIFLFNAGIGGCKINERTFWTNDTKCRLFDEIYVFSTVQSLL